MTPTPETLGSVTEEGIASRSQGAGEPGWLTDVRLAAFKRYLDQPWPDSRKDEYWRSTPFRRFDVSANLVTDAGSRSDIPTGGLSAGLDRAAGIAMCDAGVAFVEVDNQLAAAGLVVADLATAADGPYAKVIEEHLGSLTTIDREGTGGDEDRTVTVSDAAWTHGAFVYIPPELELADRPIGVRIHVERAGAHLPRVLIVVGHHSKAVVYLEHSSAELADPAVVNEVVEFVVGDGASLDVVSLQEWRGDIAHLALHKAAVGRDGDYRHFSVNIGGTTMRLRPEVDLVGPGARCLPRGVYFADDNQHMDIQPYIRHIAPNATSRVFFKGALQGACRTVFRGNVYVGPEARGTDSEENNRTLVLTDGAKADSTPFLEIHNADVKCGHGSATGQLDEDHLFYFQARAIDREDAVRLIVYGFFEEVLRHVDLPGVRERTMAHIEREIDQADLNRIGVKHHQTAPGVEPTDGPLVAKADLVAEVA